MPIPNPEYFIPNVIVAPTSSETHRATIFEEMHTNPAYQPPPLSPWMILQALTNHPDEIGFIFVANIAKGLAATIEQHDQTHHLEKQQLQDHIRGMEDKIEHYENTFTHPPEGYVENNEHYPSLTIPIGNGLFWPAKWVKQLDSGQVAMLSTQDGPTSKPIITEVYASPAFSTNPIDPMPYWFHDLLTRPSPLFLVLRDAIADLDNWGILADVLRFRNLNEQVSKVHAEIAVLEAKLESIRLTRTLTQSRLEASQAHSQVGHLENFSPGHTVNIAQEGWKKRNPSYAAVAD